MKTLLLIIIALAIGLGIRAQSLSPFAISSTGNFSSGTGFSLSSTTGEISMIETFSQGSVILTQGFNQPRDMFVGIDGPGNGIFLTGFYPNPSDGNFRALVEIPEPGNIRFRIIDCSGKLIWQNEKYQQKGSISYDITVNAFADGLYFVETSFQNVSGENKRQINSINIIH